MFVNDAFSCSHRAHSSLHAITKFLPSYSGILLNEEVTALESVLNSPSKPIAALVGGAKISTKINIIEYLITKMDYIIIGGGMANTFLVANGFSVGKSLYEKDSVTLAKSILEKSKKERNKDSVLLVAKDLASSAKLLCFDEMEIKDIADAMILSRLFQIMFDEGVILVTTSNHCLLYTSDAADE